MRRWHWIASKYPYTWNQKRDGESAFRNWRRNLPIFDASLRNWTQTKCRTTSTWKYRYWTKTERGAIKVDKLSNKNSWWVCSVRCQRCGLQFTYITWWHPCWVQLPCWRWRRHTYEDRLCAKYYVHHTCTFTSWLLTETSSWFETSIRSERNPCCSATSYGHKWRPYRGAFKAVVNTETKEILGASIFSEGSQEIINHYCCYGHNKIPHLLFKTNLFSPNLGWEHLNLVLEIYWNLILTDSPLMAVFSSTKHQICLFSHFCYNRETWT